MQPCYVPVLLCVTNLPLNICNCICKCHSGSVDLFAQRSVLQHSCENIVGSIYHWSFLVNNYELIFWLEYEYNLSTCLYWPYPCKQRFGGTCIWTAIYQEKAYLMSTAQLPVYALLLTSWHILNEDVHFLNDLQWKLLVSYKSLYLSINSIYMDGYLPRERQTYVNCSTANICTTAHFMTY